MQKVAVIGLGRFGLALAESLAREGIEVIAIDNTSPEVDLVKDKVALAVTADATDLETLRSLGLGKVDYVVVAIGEDFEACQLAMLAARDLDYPRVYARANDRVKETILRRLGADEVILPEEQAALKLAQKLAKPNLEDLVDIGSEHSFVQVKAPRKVLGKRLADLHLRKNYGINLVAMRKPGTGAGPGAGVDQISIPDADTKPAENDVLMLVGKNKDIDRFLRETE
jgi:trk system potassium uptake protein